MKRAVTYCRELRERAKRDNKSLITIDVPGICLQAPVDSATAKEVAEFLVRIVRKEHSDHA